MRRTILLLALGAIQVLAAPPSPTERRFAVKQLEGSRRLFLDSVKGLSQAQWQFKPAADRWSIAECAEHITLTEDMLFQMVTQKIMKTEPVPRMGAINVQDDEEVVRSAKDRSQKAKAPEPLRPSGKWATRDDVIKEFRRLRARTIEYITYTEDDLRGHVMASGPGRIRDAYQYLMIISGHCERHTAQIEEVKSDPNYPKN